MPRDRNHPLAVAVTGVMALLVAVVFTGAGLGGLYLLWFGYDPDQSLSGIGLLIATGICLVFVAGGPYFAWTLVRPTEGKSASAATGLDRSGERSKPAEKAGSNQPRALQGQEPPRDAVVVARMPPAFRIGLLLVTIVGGVAMVAGALTIDQWSQQAPYWMRYALGGIGLLVLVGGLHSIVRSRFVYFFATADGVYLHPDQLTTARTEWIFVPWSNIRDVYETEAIPAGAQGGRTKAIAFEVLTTGDERERWLPASTTTVETGVGDSETECARVVCGGMGIDVDNNVPKLQRLWANAR